MLRGTSTEPIAFFTAYNRHLNRNIAGFQTGSCTNCLVQNKASEDGTDNKMEHAGEESGEFLSSDSDDES